MAVTAAASWPRARSTGGTVEGRSKNGEPRSRDCVQNRHSGQFLRVHQIQPPRASKSNSPNEGESMDVILVAKLGAKTHMKPFLLKEL